VRKAICRAAIASSRAALLVIDGETPAFRAAVRRQREATDACFAATLAVHEWYGGAMPDALARELTDFNTDVRAALKWPEPGDACPILVRADLPPGSPRTPPFVGGQAARRRGVGSTPAAAAAALHGPTTRQEVRA
jgi:hypothetical protein